MSHTGQYSTNTNVYVPPVYVPRTTLPISPITYEPTVDPDIVQDTFTQYAPLNDPVFTGTVTLPQPNPASNDQTAATTQFCKSAVNAKVATLINGAPEALNTLQELTNLATDVIDLDATKADANNITSWMVLTDGYPRENRKL